MTIHLWSGMGIRESLTSEDLEYIMGREYLMKRYAKTSVLIIDEISMLSGDFLASLDVLLQRARVSPEPFGGIQVVLVGDFFQLPPVSRNNFSEFAFEHPSWKEFRLAICTLTTQYRQGKPPLQRGMSEGQEDLDSEINPQSRHSSSTAPLQRSSQEQDPLLTILGEIRSGEVSSHSLSLLTARNI